MSPAVVRDGARVTGTVEVLVPEITRLVAPGRLATVQTTWSWPASFACACTATSCTARVSGSTGGWATAALGITNALAGGTGISQAAYAVIGRGDGAYVVGRVTDGAGAPLTGVSVRLRGPRAATATTGADGTYRLRAARGTYRVSAALRGRSFRPASRTVRLPGDGVRTANFQADELTVSGRLTTIECAGTLCRGASSAPGVTVVARRVDGAGRASATTGAEGRYEITARRGRYDVAPEGAGWDPAVRVVASSTDLADFRACDAAASASLHAERRLGAGPPCEAGLRVELVNGAVEPVSYYGTVGIEGIVDGAVIRRQRSGRRGGFLEQLPSGRYRVETPYHRRPRFVELAAGDSETVRFLFPEGCGRTASARPAHVTHQGTDRFDRIAARCEVVRRR